MNHNPLKLKPFSGSALKVIAVISMTIDHIALYVMARNLHIQEFWLYEVLRGIGRLAFPIFAFLIIEGFFHTHNVLRYVATLLIFAIVSEIPWYLLGQYGSHNVLFTLLLGLIAVYLTDRIPKDSWAFFIPSLCVAIIASWIKADYSWHGIGLMMVFYLFHEKPFPYFLIGLPFLMEYGIVGSCSGILACLLYNGNRGFIRGKWLKYCFYLFYPLHLIMIWLFLYEQLL